MIYTKLKFKMCFLIVIQLFVCAGLISGQCGDVNSSGAVDIIDALLIAQNYVGLYPAPFDSTLADANGNGKNDIVDALLVAQYYVGLIDALPGCPEAPTQSAAGQSPGVTTPKPTFEPNRTQAPYPDVDASGCGGWIFKDNVCTARYCISDLSSEDCAKCGGNGSPDCLVVGSKGAVSGSWPPVTAINGDEPWLYSRSTTFGITMAGACQFGIYNVCSSLLKSGDKYYQKECTLFCETYPDLCADDPKQSFRGNWAAPQGNYYTQFWPNLPGDWDNYLSCGECFEIRRTKKDGTDYQEGESGYTPPITVIINDSCPCSANAKWCCGAGRNHCYEVSDFKYGCPMPPGADAPDDRDPQEGESIHIDLGAIAMARLQTGDPNGDIIDGVIPIKYRRVSCPVVGNIHVWMTRNASSYWFGLSVVNVAGLGSVTHVEALLETGEWLPMVRDPNYTSSRPQERSGTWVTPLNTGPYKFPLSFRFTDPSGKTLLAENIVTAWAPENKELNNMYFVDTGVQF